MNLISIFAYIILNNNKMAKEFLRDGYHKYRSKDGSREYTKKNITTTGKRASGRLGETVSCKFLNN